MATFGNLINPTSIVFDNSPNGGDISRPAGDAQHRRVRPDPERCREPDHRGAGWLDVHADITVQKTDLSGGVDHIELAPDECTIYYTSEGAAIHTYNKCTATQGPDFNQVPFTQPVSSTQNSAFGLRILSNNDVLVADSGNVLELDPSGNVIQTYPCSSMPSCGNSLFADEHRSHRHLVLDRRLQLGQHLPGQHRHGRRHADDIDRRPRQHLRPLRRQSARGGCAGES